MKAIYTPLFFMLFIMLGLKTQAQSALEKDVRSTIDRFFAGMKKGDSAAVHAQLLPEARLTTTYTKDRIPGYKEESIAGFLRSVGSPRTEAADERILSYDIRIDGNLATVWTDYAFYIGTQFSHCGVNAFQLVRTPEQWKILQITDTRRKTDCFEAPAPAGIDSLLNRWHRAAAQADEETFFGLMTADGVYIGTDETEYWKRDELRKWSEKYFARDSAWTFHPFARNIYLSDDGQTAWWDEKLHTGMGLCRGSGTLSRTAEGWKIRQFVLSLAVPNDKIDPFMELMKTPPATK